IRLILPLKTPSTSKSITRPAFTPANKIRAQINVGAKLAGHYCAAARPSYPAAQQRRPTHCTDCLRELI
ncbi:MAG: hypothetical protein ABSC89_16430, partial [Verrucomicrobiota bacterium]